MVDGLAKQKMKEKPVAELCSFQNAVTTADGARLTRGHHSQNFAYQVRDYLTGALLYYQHLCQRGKDHLCEDKYRFTDLAAPHGHFGFEVGRHVVFKPFPMPRGKRPCQLCVLPAGDFA